MAISINLQMTRREWADFADWLDERYSPSGWRFDGRSKVEHDDVRVWVKDMRGMPNSYVRNSIRLLINERENEEFTIIKMFHNSAGVNSPGVYRAIG